MSEAWAETTAYQPDVQPFSRALVQVSKAASAPSPSSMPKSARHPDTRAIVAVLIEGKALFKTWHDIDPAEETAALLLMAEALSGSAAPAEIRAAQLGHSQHSNRAPRPAELLAIVRANRPQRSDAEKVADGEALARADNQRLAVTGSMIRWHWRAGQAAEMFILGGPGEMRASTSNGRVIAPMFKHGPNGAPGEWFVSRDDARILADAYTDNRATYRIKGNTVVAVDADGIEWTPDHARQVA